MLGRRDEAYGMKEISMGPVRGSSWLGPGPLARRDEWLYWLEGTGLPSQYPGPAPPSSGPGLEPHRKSESRCKPGHGPVLRLFGLPVTVAGLELLGTRLALSGTRTGASSGLSTDYYCPPSV